MWYLYRRSLRSNGWPGCEQRFPFGSVQFVPASDGFLNSGWHLVPRVDSYFRVRCNPGLIGLRTMPIGSLPPRFRRGGASEPVSCDFCPALCGYRRLVWQLFKTQPPNSYGFVFTLQNPAYRKLMVLLGHLAGRIVVHPKPSQVNAFAWRHPACIVMRIMAFRGIEAFLPGSHPGNVSLVLITAIAERVLPLQA